MIHGDDKAKEMARSILPSRWRGAGKLRAFIHRSARREVSQSLHLLARDPEAWDDGVELGEHARLELPHLVSRRRGSDKLNHFERWAVERTRELPKPSRLGHLRSLLPGGLIGQHALLHLGRRYELAEHEDLPWRPWVFARKLLLDRGELAELLRELIEVGDGVRSLHLAMKHAERVSQARTPVTLGERRLAGLHDVLPFLDWLERNRSTRFVVDGFCRAFKQTRDVQLALAQTVKRQVIPVSDVEWVRLH